MTVLVLSQQGGILGGIGQALAMSKPITKAGVQYNHLQNELVKAKIKIEMVKAKDFDEISFNELEKEIDSLTNQVANLERPPDVYLWSIIVAVLTSGLLFVGRYRVIQFVSMSLVLKLKGFSIILKLG